MSNIPVDLKYVKSHEWVRVNDDGTITVGISDSAQDQLGDMVFVELPEVGTEVTKDDEIVVIESVKAASDIADLEAAVMAARDEVGAAAAELRF